jgi:TonB family protein
VIKGLAPSSDKAALEWLYGSSWAPVLFQERPVEVGYVFKFTLTAPSGLAPDAAQASQLPVRMLAATDAGSTDTLVPQLEARRLEDVLAHVGELPRSPERDSIWVAAMTLRSGPKAGVELAETLVQGADERRLVLGSAALRCLRMREYDAAEKLVHAATSDEPPGSKAQERLALMGMALFTGLRRHEELGIGRTDPRFPAVRMLELATGVSTESRGLFAAELGSVPTGAFGRPVRSPQSSAELGLKDFVLPPDVLLDVGLALADFTITGQAPLGWRVRQRFTFYGVGMDLFVVLQEGEARVLGIAGGRLPPILWGLGKRAGALVDAGDLAAARQWIEWARDSLEETQDTGWAGFFVRSTPEALATADGIQEAATALVSTGSMRLLTYRGDHRTQEWPVVPNLALPPDVVPFSETMTRPVLRSSPNGKRSPDYPAEVREVGVSGLLIVRCILSVEGRAEDCRIVKPLVPALDREVLQWLAGSSWSPVTLDGKPQRVSYVFNFNFRLERAAPAKAPPGGR